MRKILLSADPPNEPQGCGPSNHGRPTTTLTTIDVSTGLSTATLVLNGRPDDPNYLQSNQDRSYVITEVASTPTSPATTSVAVIDRGTASAVTPIPVTGQFDALVFDPNTSTTAPYCSPRKPTPNGATITHVTIIDTDTATPIGPPINLAGQPADTAIIWSIRPHPPSHPHHHGDQTWHHHHHHHPDHHRLGGGDNENLIMV